MSRPWLLAPQSQLTLACGMNAGHAAGFGDVVAKAIIARNGKVTIPLEVRRALRLSTGDRVAFLEVGPGRFEITRAMCSIRDLKGMFGKARRVVAIEEMNAAIAMRAKSGGKARTQ